MLSLLKPLLPIPLLCAAVLAQPFPTLSENMEADVYRKTQRLLARDAARRKTNLMLEPRLSLAFLSQADLEGTGRGVNEVLTGVGCDIGIRKHFSPFFGFRLATGVTIGPTYSFVEVDTFEVLNPGAAKEDTLPGRMYFSGGTNGHTVLTGTVLGLVFGPGVGRVSFEPGLGFIYGRHTAARDTLKGEAGTYVADPKRHFTLFYGSARTSLVFGAEDEFNPGLTVEFNGSFFRMALGLAYTFYGI